MTTGTKWVIGCAVAGIATLVVIVLGIVAFFLLAGRGHGSADHTPPTAAPATQSEWPPATPEPTRETTSSASTVDRSSTPNRIVFIVSDEPAFTVYMRIPATRLDEIKAKSPALAGAEQVGWEAFEQGRARYVRSHVVKNEYPQHRVADGLVALLAQNEGTPIGLTWNGGIAITNNDYQHAQRTFRRYQDDAGEYERTRNNDPRGDPVHPRAHFEPLLGDPYLAGTGESSE
jgi:hypothetical protein